MQPTPQLQEWELRRVEQLFQNGKSEEALQEARNLERKNNLDAIEKLKIQLLKSLILSKNGSPSKALVVAEKAFKESQRISDPLIIINALISKATALLELSRFSECLRTIEDGEKLIRSHSCDHIVAAERDSTLKQIKAKIFRKKGDLNLALEILLTSLAARKELGDSFAIADTLSDVGVVYASQGNFNSALEHLQESLTYFEKTGNITSIAKLHNNIGMIYWQLGNNDLALKFFQKSLAFSQELGNKRYIASLLSNIGLVHWNRGELDSALDFLQQSLLQLEELENKGEKTACLNNIGVIYQIKGEFDLALDFFQRSLAIATETENKLEIANCYNNIGLVSEYKGEIENSEIYNSKSLELFEELGNDFDTCQPLLHLIRLAILSGSVEKAQPFLEKLEIMNNKEDIKVVSQYYRVAKACVLKTSSRIISRAEAQQLFQQVADEDPVKNDLTVEAMLNLCDLLLQELKISGDEEVLNEVKSLLEQLFKVAKDQNNHLLLAYTYLLQSKAALLELNPKLSRYLLTQAQLIADEKGFQKLARTISNEFDTLLDQLAIWDDYIDRNASLPERLELAQLEDLVTRMLRKKMLDIPEQPSEEPVMLLIIAAGGLTLYSKTFIEEAEIDEHLIGGFLSAVGSFGSEIFASAGVIERIMYEEYTLALKTFDSLTFCYAFRGPSYTALLKLDQLSQKIHASPPIWSGLTRTLETGQLIGKLEENIIEEVFNEVFS